MLETLKTFYQRMAVRRVFSNWAYTYEQDVRRHVYTAASAIAQELASRLREEMKITDLGVGTGLIWENLHIPDDTIITGLDIVPAMLEQASANTYIRYLYLCDVGKQTWPIEETSQDIIVAAGLFEYLTESMALHVLCEASRVLKPGGELIFTYIPIDKNRSFFWRGKSGAILSCHYTSEWFEKKSSFVIHHHSESFPGSIFDNGDTYNYRLLSMKKISNVHS